MRPEIAPLLGLALIVAGCDRQSDPAPQPKPDVTAKAPPEQVVEIMGPLDRSNKGKPMPDISFTGPNGEPVKLSDFKGQPLLVNLWATWCGPCIAEMPALDKLATREAGRIQVIALSQDMKGRPAVDRWWKDQSLATLQPYIDAKADMSFALGGGTLPTTVYYGKDGRELWRIVGASQWDGEAAKALLEEGV